MHINIISDIHADIHSYNALDTLLSNKQGVNTLVIAGDTCSVTKPETYVEILNHAKRIYTNVLLIPGNHEYYGTSIENGNQLFETICTSTGCISLNDKRTDIDGYKFVGTPLWSNASGYSNEIRDYMAIKGLDFGTRTTLYEDCLYYLEPKVDDAIVVTHHMPSKRMVHPIYWKVPLNIATHYYSNLDELVCRCKVWICGHSHKPMTCKFMSATCYLWPRGYNQETRVKSPKTIYI